MLKGTATLTAQGERVCLKEPRIQNIFCLKSYKVGHERAIQAPAGRASQIAKSCLLGRQELVRPFHVLLARISNKT